MYTWVMVMNGDVMQITGEMIGESTERKKKTKRKVEISCVIISAIKMNKERRKRHK